MTIDELKVMWKLLEDVPVEMDKDGDTVIARDFAKWEKGTSILAIWQWFDEKCPNGLVRDLM